MQSFQSGENPTARRLKTVQNLEAAFQSGLQQAITPLAGIVVIDVVEGSAMAALPFMTGVLNQRPSSFASLQEAIHWATASGRHC